MKTWPRLGESRERADSGAAIRLGTTSRHLGPGSPSRLTWGSALVLFMRVLAVLWVFQGLLQWGAVLLPREPLFYAAAPAWGAAVIFFAVLDLVAAVGLWLATPWGGVIWLFGAIAQIFVALALPGFFSTPWIGANMGLIFAYFALTWRAGRSKAALGERKPR